MGQYFLGLTEEEKNNILDKHKTVYNGYSVKQNVSNLQPLYVQDFANDKEGITVNNKGVVSSYKNMSINESEESEQYEKVDYLGVDEEINEEPFQDIFDIFSDDEKESKKVPYTADAVKFIIDNIKSCKTEEQLESAMKMAENLYNTNDDVNDAYKQRINTAYKRKSDELGNYLSKGKLNKVLNDLESETEFKEDLDSIKESIVDTLKWFKKIK